MLALFFLWACSAESLQISIPPKGIASVHQEDLKRDIWALEQESEANAWWIKRLSQFDGFVNIDDNSSCFIHQGSEKGWGYWISTQPDDLEVRLATLLAFVKSSDRLRETKSYQYCFGKPMDISDWKSQEIGNISGADLRVEDDVWQSTIPSNQSFSQINFEILEKNIRYIISSNSPELVEVSKP